MSEETVRLLVLEDNPGDVRLLEMALAETPTAHFHLTHFGQLGEAMDHVRSGQGFDAALVDLGLPDSQGLDTLRSLMNVSAELPVLVFTSNDDEMLGIRAMQVGAEDYLTKGRPSGKEIARAVRYAIERKRMSLELRRARDAALESARLKSAFLANMSHEIRTPLNIITGFGGLIQDHAREAEDEWLIDSMGAVTRACDRLLQTVDGILDLSKIESQNFSVHPEPIFVANLVEALAREFRPLAEGKGLTLEIETKVRSIVLFDKYCLAHALQNLLQNAIKFTKQGGVRIHVGRDAEGEIAIVVQDTGIGIGESFLPRLFDSFSQEHSGYAREFEGSGLGLALTRRFLELNGATVSVASRPGSGSTFTIGIPRRCELVGAPAAVEPKPAAKAAARPNRDADQPPTVLVVEDDAATQRYMKQLLGDRYRVVVASTAEEMCACLESLDGSIRLVLMDLSLRGGKDGVELTRMIHAERRWGELPVIAVTAHALAEDRRRVLEAGCDGFVAKPFDSQVLLGLMDELLTSPSSLAGRRRELLN